MFYFLLFIVISTILGSPTLSVKVVPLAASAHADCANLTAIAVSDGIHLSSQSVLPWTADAVIFNRLSISEDIESQVETSDQPIIYLVPNEVGTPTPRENHMLDLPAIRSFERHFSTIGFILFLLIILLICLTIKFTAF